MILKNDKNYNLNELRIEMVNDINGIHVQICIDQDFIAVKDNYGYILGKTLGGDSSLYRFEMTNVETTTNCYRILLDEIKETDSNSMVEMLLSI